MSSERYTASPSSKPLRQVPTHPVSIFDGCTSGETDVIVGAPLYRAMRDAFDGLLAVAAKKRAPN